MEPPGGSAVFAKYSEEFFEILQVTSFDNLKGIFLKISS